MVPAQYKPKTLPGHAVGKASSSADGKKQSGAAATLSPKADSPGKKAGKAALPVHETV